MAQDREKALDAALAQIDRQFGKGSIMRLGDEVRAPMEVIPTGSIALDIALGLGGLPRGRVVEIYGPESSGKTSLALHAVANAQKAGGIAAFIDAEHALDPDYAKKLGVDTDALLVSQPDTGEQALEIMDMLIRSGALDVIVIDSVAALVPRAEIEGEMGDSHVGLQARLMSQAMRKITGALSQSNTTAIFINQLREKIGVFFGCFSYDTRVSLADGTQEKIGKIVNQKMDVEVLSYDPETDRIVARRVVNWFDNGATDQFLQFTVAKASGNGRAQFAATPNHLIRTPGGWREAGELLEGDRVMLAEPERLSAQQWQVILGGLMGDANLSPNPPGEAGVRFRMGHGAKQVDYLDWKASLLANIAQTRTTNARGAAFVDCTPLPELSELREVVYFGDGKKHLSWDFLKALTPLALAIWYLDDGCFTLRSKGRQQRTEGGSGRLEICVDAMSPGSRERLLEHLRDAYGLDVTLTQRGAKRQQVLRFTTEATARFQEIIATYVHPSMEYKLLPRFRGRFAVEPQFQEARLRPVPARVLDIHVKAPTRSMHRFDIEVEGNHNYFVDGVMVHNSPETTTGGKALKFYSSVRLDIRRIETLKDGGESVGNRTRVKVVKNKCLAAGSRIFDPLTGITHRIEDIVAQREAVHVVAMDKEGRLQPKRVTDWFDQGEQDVVRVALKGGAALTVTPDHRVFTEAGWVEAAKLRPGDRVAQPRTFSRFGDEQPIQPDHARLLGYLAGDGYVGGKTPVPFTNVVAALQDDAAAIAASMGKLAWEESLPPCVFSPGISAAVVSNLVFGLFETDGWVSREQTGAIRAGFSTASEQLAHQIQWLLHRFGVCSSVRQYDPTGKRPSISKGREVRSRRDCFEVRVAGVDNVTAFAAAIPTWGPRGSALVEALAAIDGRRRGSQQVYLPINVRAAVLAHLRTRGITALEAARLIGRPEKDARGGMSVVLGHSRLRRDRVAALAEALDDAFLQQLLAEEVVYSTVRWVQAAGRVQTFDLEVEELHNLVADHVVVHNCSPPFKQAEFDILYGIGISREGGLIDMGVEQGFVRKSGAWYTYDGDQLGQGKENARAFLRDNPDLADEIEKKIKEKLGIGAKLDDPARAPLASVPPVPAPVDF